MMILLRCFLVAVIASITLPVAGRADEPPARPRLMGLTVRAGGFDRRESLVAFPVPADRLGPKVVEALADGPIALTVTDPGGSKPSVAQVARLADGSIRGTWFLTRPIASGGEARFDVDGASVASEARTPWSVVEATAGAVEFRNRDRPVFRYNAAPVASPKGDANLARDAYIHPAFSPSGALVTGDFSSYHPHHRGFFLAYTHTKWGDLAPDFWNFQNGTGKIVADGWDRPALGPVSARFEARHRWEAKARGPQGGNSRVALRERWDVELFDIPGSPIWLFDLTSTQRAEGEPLELVPYRYGGMAYRSAEPSVRGPIDVLTAEGRHRLDGDQKPTRWVDLTGPIADLSPNYAGAMIADHPSNPTFPTVARIHPITLPFFSFVPGHDAPLTIRVDEPTTFRYRVMIHDGRPDPALNDRIAHDFADPPEVVLD